MGLKIVIPIGYQRVKKISLTAMPQGGLKIQLAEPGIEDPQTPQGGLK